MELYHTPVLLEQSIEGLAIKPDGVYVDCTFGGGGHSRAILSKLTTGKLIAFDQDADALANQPEDARLILIQGNFRYLRNYLKYQKFEKIDGILADLGVSSHHFDDQTRGFSFRWDAALDMRMNQHATLTARTVLNEYEPQKLRTIFRLYGELNEAGRIVHYIEKYRAEKPIDTVPQFKELLEPIMPPKAQSKLLAKIFQALRIEVNQEMEALKEMLEQSVEVLKPGGRLVVITYHSLEDRLVKNYIKNGLFDGEPAKDLYGNVSVPFASVNRKIIIPGENEIEQNSRARSAKLRIAEKI
ncbi:MAG TPA: 16S rRNA (cytosine(1402)-N(4))-methyltransferase [Marinilabiliales bacterium]|jgi:16S rRNA (cytosine1402-N4)-methyltransferase|nr:MAG: 16S rRNA (cytosine(1402)-N(4))-methyltransferase [Bacteroidetes bacterium GWA2_40_14]OFX65604.1 MAG: 16S rRNA (cytosine(1402)-N(4))-methyltransferase [Bacteroidetes bacterium GWC2_40_13]OFX75784.1 MAG: 16S rRNA (cytosine(1402)-N(4))-methyltransferase [Bacteroidetes bacterium GWD2_40_43]OFX94943.1 MAG: 16S rRNA (cytosine(1402)-N(4))-methyltransferase [Bacteroidetes bacterium GWE2_40_63]OFY23455.1 MAG: 16S rRNA (cytosine(1402)-N(4))-methyltransferase [Bacteroidetes bacterium GWF2_40_13]O